MADEIILELWRIKDEIACEHGYDLDSFSTYLRSRTYAVIEQADSPTTAPLLVEHNTAPEGNSVIYQRQ